MKIICAGCSTVFSSIEELEGNKRKNCPVCQYHLFMFSSENMSIGHKDFMLNEKQKQIISYLKQILDEKRKIPNIKEIKEQLNFNSISALYYHFNILKDKGFLTFKQGRIHTLQLLPKSYLSENLISISDKQISILQIIESFISKHNQSPTIEELQRLSRIKSLATLAYHLNKLEELELITRKKYKHRTIEISEKGKLFIKSLSLIRNDTL